MSLAKGTKAKYIRDLLDKALELPLPQMSTEEFERVFGMRISTQELASLTLAEVMVRQLVLKAAAGNDKSIQEVLDRLLGKAMQTVETTSHTYNYHDFLVECKRADESEAKPVLREIVDVPALPGIPEESDVLSDLL